MGAGTIVRDSKLLSTNLLIFHKIKVQSWHFSLKIDVDCWGDLSDAGYMTGGNGVADCDVEIEMAIKRGVTWGGKKGDKGSLDYTRGEVLKNLKSDIADLEKAGKIEKLRRVRIEDGHTQVKLARGAYEAETVGIDSTDLKLVIADMHSLADAIEAKNYDDTIKEMHDRISTQMRSAQGGRVKVAAWLATLAADKQAEYKALQGTKERHGWRAANGYTK